MVNIWDDSPNAKYINCLIYIFKHYNFMMIDGYDRYASELGMGPGEINSISSIAWYKAWDILTENNARMSVFQDLRGNNHRYGDHGSYNLEYAFIALSAWDDCGDLLDIDNIDELRILAKLGNAPAVLLLMAAHANNLYKKYELAKSS